MNFARTNSGRQFIALFVFATALTLSLPRLDFLGSDAEVAAVGVLLAFTVELPLLFYFAVLRPAGTAWYAALPLVGLGYLLCRLWFVPAANPMLAQALVLIVPLELLLASILALKARRALTDMRSAAYSGDFIDRLTAALRREFGAYRVVDALAYEIGLLYYALGGKPAVGLTASDEPHAYHEKIGLRQVYLVALLVGGAEILVVHLVAAAYSTKLAWTLTAIEFYGVVWVLGLIRSVADLPVVLAKDGLQVRFSVVYSIFVPYAEIESIRRTGLHAIDRRASGYLNCSFLETPICVLRLKNARMARLPYGMQKRVSEIGLAADKPAEFLTQLEQRIAGWKIASVQSGRTNDPEIVR